MNWFKRVFGKRNFRTVHSEKCDAFVIYDLFRIRRDVNATVVLLLDIERGEHICYVDYNGKQRQVSIDYILPHTTELKFIIKKYKIKY